MASSLSRAAHKIGDKIDEVAAKNAAKNNDQINNPQSTNYGAHSSNLGNKVDPRFDSDLDNRNNPASHVGGYDGGHHNTHGGLGTTGNTGLGSSGYGSSNTHGSTTNDPGYNDPRSTNAGPHSSNLANKLDPRVDSDRDGRNDPTSRTGGYGNTQDSSYGASHGAGFGSGPTGGYSTTTAPHNTSNIHHDNPRSANDGPHSSSLANKLDPRVDSDRDGRNDPTSRTGGYGNTQSGIGSNTGHHTSAHPATTHDTHTGYSGSNVGYDNGRSTNAGPHNSNLLNKLDPRVDSDLDNRNNPTSRVGGYGDQQSNAYGAPAAGGYAANNTVGGAGYGSGVGGAGTGYTGTNDQYDNVRSSNAGPHSSNLLNKLDPRVDSDRDGRNDPTSRTGGYGNTQDGRY